MGIGCQKSDYEKFHAIVDKLMGLNESALDLTVTEQIIVFKGVLMGWTSTYGVRAMSKEDMPNYIIDINRLTIERILKKHCLWQEQQ